MVDIPAVCAQPGTMLHFRMPVIQCAVEAFQAACLAIRGKLCNVCQYSWIQQYL